MTMTLGNSGALAGRIQQPQPQQATETRSVEQEPDSTDPATVSDPSRPEYDPKSPYYDPTLDRTTDQFCAGLSITPTYKQGGRPSARIVNRATRRG